MNVARPLQPRTRHPIRTARRRRFAGGLLSPIAKGDEVPISLRVVRVAPLCCAKLLFEGHHSSMIWSADVSAPMRLAAFKSKWSMCVKYALPCWATHCVGYWCDAPVASVTGDDVVFGNPCH